MAKASIDGIDIPAVVIMRYGVGDCPPVVGPDHNGEVDTGRGVVAH